MLSTVVAALTSALRLPQTLLLVCVAVSESSVVEGESQIQMGRFISFLQVGMKASPP